MNSQNPGNEPKSDENEHESPASVSTPSSAQIPRSQSQSLAFDNGTGQHSAAMGKTPIDRLLESASITPYSLPGSENSGHFADNTHRWYDFGDLVETSPLKVSMAWQIFILELDKLLLPQTMVQCS